MKKLVIAAVLLFLTACSPSSSFVQGEVVSCESISQDPTFTGGIELDCLDGSQGAQLGALRGPIVVNVWGSWCGPCEEEIPVFRAFHEKAKDKVQLIGVDVEEANLNDGRTFVQGNGITWPFTPILWDGCSCYMVYRSRWQRCLQTHRNHQRSRSDSCANRKTSWSASLVLIL
jgi:thiol-disulfide isomerase/thioredoxin